MKNTNVFCKQFRVGCKYAIKGYDNQNCWIENFKSGNYYKCPYKDKQEPNEVVI